MRFPGDLYFFCKMRILDKLFYPLCWCQGWNALIRKFSEYRTFGTNLVTNEAFRCRKKTNESIFFFLASLRLWFMGITWGESIYLLHFRQQLKPSLTDGGCKHRAHAVFLRSTETLWVIYWAKVGIKWVLLTNLSRCVFLSRGCNVNFPQKGRRTNPPEPPVRLQLWVTLLEMQDKQTKQGIGDEPGLLAKQSGLALAQASWGTRLCVCLFDRDGVVTRRSAEVGGVIVERDWLTQGWRQRQWRRPVLSLIESAQAI